MPRLEDRRGARRPLTGRRTRQRCYRRQRPYPNRIPQSPSPRSRAGRCDPSARHGGVVVRGDASMPLEPGGVIATAEHQHPHHHVRRVSMPLESGGALRTLDLDSRSRMGASVPMPLEPGGHRDEQEGDRDLPPRVSMPLGVGRVSRSSVTTGAATSSTSVSMPSEPGGCFDVRSKCPPPKCVQKFGFYALGIGRGVATICRSRSSQARTGSQSRF